jgi:hypothetical protein
MDSLWPWMVVVAAWAVIVLLIDLYMRPNEFDWIGFMALLVLAVDAFMFCLWLTIRFLETFHGWGFPAR